VKTKKSSGKRKEEGEVVVAKRRELGDRETEEDRRNVMEAADILGPLDAL